MMTAPTEGQIVFIAGGVAQFRDGVYYSGMEDPRYLRPIQWEVKWWHPIDREPNADRLESATTERGQPQDKLHAYASKIERALGSLTDTEATLSVPDIIAVRTGQIAVIAEERDLLREELDHRILLCADRSKRVDVLEAALLEIRTNARVNVPALHAQAARIELLGNLANRGLNDGGWDLTDGCKSAALSHTPEEPPPNTGSPSVPARPDEIAANRESDAICVECGHNSHIGQCMAELPEDTHNGTHCPCGRSAHYKRGYRKQVEVMDQQFGSLIRKEGG